MEFAGLFLATSIVLSVKKREISKIRIDLYLYILYSASILNPEILDSHIFHR